jgi:ABC-type lipoprotein export system ATPase subunit
MSALNNGFGHDFEKYAKTLLKLAVAKNIAAIGVTDYFCIEGYKQLRALIADEGALKSLVGSEVAGKAAQILVLPNIEFRTSVVIVRPGGKNSKVNFHVILSDEIEPAVIEEHFLRNLYVTVESHPGSPDERWRCTLPDLQQLGRKLKEQHVEFKKEPDLVVGMMNAVVEHGEITKVLAEQQSRFQDRFLLVVPADEDLSDVSWDGGAHLTRKLLIRKSHMLFSANPGTRAFGLGRKHATVQEFRREFEKLKPCIHGSDSHSFDSLFEPAQKRYLWIEADPTFQGLRQLLYEPGDRVHIGDEPPSFARVKQNATKYMRDLTFERTDVAENREKWFSGTIPLNHGLIAIIGNKGSGKSALADILALLGESKAPNFSFLNEERFLAPKSHLGAMFRATVGWQSGRPASRSLGERVDVAAPELVKYIPQQYLEEICAELKESSDTQFDRELMEVIFSHVTEAQRLGKETLGDLIQHMSGVKQQGIDQLTRELTSVNAAIVATEDQMTAEFRRSVEAQLAQRRAELAAHDKARPTEVKSPEQDADVQEASKAVSAELAILQGRIAELQKTLDSEGEELTISARRIAAADRLLARIDNLERQVGTFYSESAEDGETLALDIPQLVALQVDRGPIINARRSAQERSQTARNALNLEESGSLAAQRDAVAAEASAKREQLDEPQQRYLEYLQQLAEWQSKRAEIEGSADNSHSVRGLEAKLASLVALPSRLTELKDGRLRLVREIFDGKQQLRADFARLYSPVQEYIDKHQVAQQRGALQFFASITVDGLVDAVLNMIDQRRKGSFQGEPEGSERLRQLVAGADLGTPEGVEVFLSKVQSHLERDQSDATAPPVRLVEQLRQGFSPQDVYDYLYGLEYLRPRFELRWQDKSLDQLSPGERGNLLLVFYLLIDKRDVPLIIDQPEENLDNQTIATTLVPAIRYAKERRQIIIVTHNPNLAVVCDAEQIIHASIDKTDGNRVTFTAGSIENPRITQLIVDVLEGTKPLFDLRDDRYDVLERLS